MFCLDFFFFFHVTKTEGLLLCCKSSVNSIDFGVKLSQQFLNKNLIASKCLLEIESCFFLSLSEFSFYWIFLEFSKQSVWWYRQKNIIRRRRIEKGKMTEIAIDNFLFIKSFVFFLLIIYFMLYYDDIIIYFKYTKIFYISRYVNYFFQ